MNELLCREFNVDVGDSFKKIAGVKDPVIPWHDENGILYAGIEKFLPDETAMDLRDEARPLCSAKRHIGKSMQILLFF